MIVRLDRDRPKKSIVVAGGACWGHCGSQQLADRMAIEEDLLVADLERLVAGGDAALDEILARILQVLRRSVP
jgi:hypothetical protein